jgi:hypothetical protein
MEGTQSKASFVFQEKLYAKPVGSKVAARALDITKVKTEAGTTTASTPESELLKQA